MNVYEHWPGDGSTKGTSLGQKSVPKREELKTTSREYGTYEDESAPGRLPPNEWVSVGV